MRVDKSGGMNKHGYDYTINFHVPPGVLKEVLDTKKHRSFLKAEAIEYSVLIAALRQNIRNQKDKNGYPINCVTAENNKVYHKMGKTLLSFLMGVSPKSISNALSSEAFEKHPSLDGYYRIFDEEGKNATPPSIEKNSEGKNATGRGQKRNDNTVSNKVSNAESFQQQATATPCPAVVLTLDEWGYIYEREIKPLTESEMRRLAFWQTVIAESNEKVKSRLNTGKSLIDLSNVNNPDADDLGDLTDYEPLDLEWKVSMVKTCISQAKLRWQGFRFSFNNDSLNELRKFYCCNPQIDDEFITHLIELCAIIQTVQPEAEEVGLIAYELNITQFKGEIGKYDAYRWLRQCHSLGFLFRHFEEIFAQVYYYHYQNIVENQYKYDDAMLLELYESIPTVYYWDNRNLERRPKWNPSNPIG